jgi:tRNA nucleotidyltransferase/poly(A) polymerase
MIHTISKIKNKFPLMNFDFLKCENLINIINKIEGRFVGGAVRDGLLGISTYDIDISTKFFPNEVISILNNLTFNPVATGIEYGTVSVFLKPYKIEITSLRKDVKTFGRKAEVVFGGTWQEDSERRDFTFNSLYLDISEKDNYAIYDYHNGIEDLLNKKINFIGNYKLRIEEDYLRIMRFVRFFLRYGKNQEDSYKEEILNLYKFVPFMKLLSIERIIMEITSILKTEQWILGIKILNELKISELFFQKDLFICSNCKKNILILDKFVIIFHKIDLKIIEKLPLEKNIKYYLKTYIQCDWSLINLSKIFYRKKDFNIILDLLNLHYIINDKLKKEELNLFNVFIENKRNINFNHKFIEYKNNYIFKNLEGPLRGEEEIEMRINFFKSFLS